MPSSTGTLLKRIERRPLIAGGDDRWIDAPWGAQFPVSALIANSGAILNCHAGDAAP